MAPGAMQQSLSSTAGGGDITGVDEGDQGAAIQSAVSFFYTNNSQLGIKRLSMQKGLNEGKLISPLRY